MLFIFTQDLCLNIRGGESRQIWSLVDTDDQCIRCPSIRITCVKLRGAGELGDEAIFISRETLIILYMVLPLHYEA